MRYRVGNLIVDADRLAVFAADRALNAAPKVVEVLVVLCERAGSFVSKEMLRERLWPSNDADDSVLWQKVYLARKMLAKDLGPGAIETLARRGYRLTVPVGHEPFPVAPQAAPLPVVRRRGAWALGTVASAAALLVLIGAGVWNRPPIATAVTLDPPTLRAYNLGNYFLSQRTRDSLTKAEPEFDIVAASSTGSIAALGYAGLADAHASLSWMRRGDRRAAEVRAARRAAEMALRSDPRSGEAEAALGVALMTSDWDDGLAYEHQHRLGAALNVFHTLARYSPQLAQTLIARARTE